MFGDKILYESFNFIFISGSLDEENNGAAIPSGLSVPLSVGMLDIQFVADRMLCLGQKLCPKSFKLVGILKRGGE